MHNIRIQAAVVNQLLLEAIKEVCDYALNNETAFMEQGIRELDIKYGKVCHKLSYNIVNSRQEAEECVNDAYLGAWNAIPPARSNLLLSYICKIVRNISLKIYYRKDAAKRSSHYTIAMEEIEACIADSNTVEAEIEARELAR